MLKRPVPHSLAPLGTAAGCCYPVAGWTQWDGWALLGSMRRAERCAVVGDDKQARSSRTTVQFELLMDRPPSTVRNEGGSKSRKLGVPTRSRSLKGRMGQLVHRQFLRAAKPCESLLGTAAARKSLAWDEPYGTRGQASTQETGAGRARVEVSAGSKGPTRRKTREEAKFATALETARQGCGSSNRKG